MSLMSQNKTDSASFLEETKFSVPCKRIFDSQGTHEFQSSVAISRLQFFLHKYVNLVNNVEVPKLSDKSENAAVNRMIELLSKLSDLIDSTPPFPGPRRYGNLACRDWHAKIDAELESLLTDLILPNTLETNAKLLKKPIVEIQYYLGNSFGSSTRLDYGTGHELSFLAVVAAIDMMGLWGDSFNGANVLRIFSAYYELVEKLILTYTLEPAGSHGVWGLDDHFHLAYILGSSEYASAKNPPLKPSEIANKVMVDKHSTENLYCKAIAFIFTVKSGPFSEHSPILFDISKSVHTWSKVQSGLTKMYMVEVLNKFPVVQHFWFGTGFFPWINNSTGKPLHLFEGDKDNTEPGDSKFKTTSVPSQTSSTNPAFESTFIPGKFARPTTDLVSPNRLRSNYTVSRALKTEMKPPSNTNTNSRLPGNALNRFRR